MKVNKFIPFLLLNGILTLCLPSCAREAYSWESRGELTLEDYGNISSLTDLVGKRPGENVSLEKNNNPKGMLEGITVSSEEWGDKVLVESTRPVEKILVNGKEEICEYYYLDDCTYHFLAGYGLEAYLFEPHETVNYGVYKYHGFVGGPILPYIETSIRITDELIAHMDLPPNFWTEDEQRAGSYANRIYDLYDNILYRYYVWVKTTITERTNPYDFPVYYGYGLRSSATPAIAVFYDSKTLECTAVYSFADLNRYVMAERTWFDLEGNALSSELVGDLTSIPHSNFSALDGDLFSQVAIVPLETNPPEDTAESSAL